MSIFSDNCLGGGTYLVTGASSGIGRDVALMISRCGGRVIVNGRHAGRLAETLSQLDSRREHVPSVFALSDADQIADWVKELANVHGPLSGVFHAAGVELIRPVRMIKQSHLNELFGSSLFAAFGIARAVSQKNTVIDGASIVLMSSVASQAGQVGLTAYSAAKAGVDGLVRSLACELAQRRIRVNSIAAGAVKTEMHSRLTQASGDVATLEYERSHLLGFGVPNDVASGAIYLLSDASSWVTGTSIVIDGGYMVR